MRAVRHWHCTPARTSATRPPAPGHILSPNHASKKATVQEDVDWLGGRSKHEGVARDTTVPNTTLDQSDDHPDHQIGMIRKASAS
eukprot:1160671-Pelagomonas_calceolata.AAC.5